MGATQHPLIKDWEIQLDTWPRKIIAITLVLVTCGTLMYRTWWPFLAAWVTRSGTPDPATYEKATRYDPKNADHHFVLAQIYNYTTQYLNIQRAGEEYQKAVELTPYRPQHWLEMSKYYEEQGSAD